MATVAGNLKGLLRVLTILATVLHAPVYPAMARRMVTFLHLFTHIKVSVFKDSLLCYSGLGIST